jgi:hypothetical protein
MGKSVLDNLISHKSNKEERNQEKIKHISIEQLLYLPYFLNPASTQDSGKRI